MRTLDTGWFAKKNTFGYERSDIAEVAEGGNGWLESTPPVVMPFQAKAGLELTLELGVDQLRQHSLNLQSKMRRIFQDRGVSLFEPGNPEQFGAFSLLHHKNAAEMSRIWKSKGVNTDARGEFVHSAPTSSTARKNSFGRRKLSVRIPDEAESPVFPNHWHSFVIEELMNGRSCGLTGYQVAFNRIADLASALERYGYFFPVSKLRIEVGKGCCHPCLRLIRRRPKHRGIVDRHAVAECDHARRPLT